MEKKALGFILICHFEQDQASFWLFDVKALGMLQSYSLATLELLAALQRREQSGKGDN